MSRYSITPWRSAEDLLQVRQDLYQLNTDQVDRRRHAVNRVLAWKLRGSNLPHAVESTALLVDAILHHASSSSEVSLHSIRAVYTAAFTRFVTGFCDIGRARERSLDPSSMLEISRQIGMPAEFVALRHEATHEDMPGIQRLVNATEQSLSWLWNVYWSKLSGPQDSKSDRVTRTSEEAIRQARDGARAALKDYRRAQRDVLKSKGSVLDKAAAVAKCQTAAQKCVQLVGDDQVDASPVLDVLLGEKLLIPSNRELQDSMDGAFRIWDDLLVVIWAKRQPRIYQLMRMMLTALVLDENLKDVDKEAIVHWLLHLMEILSLRFGFSPNTSTPATAMRDHILKTCCLYPGPWTQQLGRTMLKSCDEVTVASWADMLDAVSLTSEAGPNVPEEMPADAVAAQGSRHAPWTRTIVTPKVPIGVVV